MVMVPLWLKGGQVEVCVTFLAVEHALAETPERLSRLMRATTAGFVLKDEYAIVSVKENHLIPHGDWTFVVW